MSKIARVRSRVIGYSQVPSTLRRNLITNASVLEDFQTKENGWFGPAFCTVVEIETEKGVIGTATAGAFNGAAKSIIDMKLATNLSNLNSIWSKWSCHLCTFSN